MLVELLLLVLVVVLFGFMSVFLFKKISSFYLSYHWVECLWTVIPMLILIFFSFPSIMALYFVEECVFLGESVFVKGFQWFWEYDSFIKIDGMKTQKFHVGSHMANDYGFLLSVDFALVLNPDYMIEFNVSSNDVIHSFAVPAAGIKVDAIPGVENIVFCDFKESGIFYGQCSELCGVNHTMMPISILSTSAISQLWLLQKISSQEICLNCKGTGFFTQEMLVDFSGKEVKLF